MAKLTDKLNSQYFESRNALNKRTGEVVEIFVENEDDVPFWKHIFDQFNLHTKVNPASKTSLKRGKPAVLKHIDRAGKFLLGIFFNTLILNFINKIYYRYKKFQCK